MTTTNGNGGSAGAAVRDAETDRARLRAIHAAMTGGDIAAAGKLAEDALFDGIDHVMVLSLVAGRREEEGRLDEALALLLRAKAAAPDAAGILNQVGLCLARMERWEEAVAEYDAALARDPGFAPALANRGSALMALARFGEARSAFEAAAARDGANLVAADGLAALALRAGDAGEARRLAQQVLARAPGLPGAVMTLAEADLAEGQAAAAEAGLRPLVADSRLADLERALAWGALGDALDAQGRFDEAFAAWREANALQQRRYQAEHGARRGTIDLLRDMSAALAGRRIPAAFGHGGRSPAKRHVFLVGFPRSGAEPIAHLLAAHPDVAMLSGQECLIDAARDWLSDARAFKAFLDAPDDALEAARAAYWRRVAEAGADPTDRVFVDDHAFNAFKLPLIARLFPDARVLFARRDPRDIVLACFAGRFGMSGPAFPLLSLAGAAELFAATMDLAEASAKAFGLYMHPVALEALIADPDGETRKMCDYVGIAPVEKTRRAAPAPGAQGIGKWRDHEDRMAPVLPLLERFIGR